MPLWSTASRPSSMADNTAENLRPLPRGRRELFLYSRSRLVEHACELAELVVPILVDPPAQIAASQGAGAFQNLRHRFGERPREPPGESAREGEDGEKGEAQGALELISAHLDPGQRQGCAGHPEQAPFVLDPNRDVHLPFVGGVREPLVRPLAERKSVANFRPARMILDGVQGIARSGRVAQDRAVHGDHGEPGLGRPAGAVHQVVHPVSRPLNAPRHRNGLGQNAGFRAQALQGLRSRVRAQHAALHEQDHDQTPRRP